MIAAHFVDVAALEVRDTSGYTKKIPTDVRDAIATVASDEWWAIQLLVWTFGESSWDTTARGDCYEYEPHPWPMDGPICLAYHSRGLGGTPWSWTPDDALGQVTLIAKVMVMSAKACPAHPLAQYAGGCNVGAAIRIAEARTEETARIFAKFAQPIVAF